MLGRVKVKSDFYVEKANSEIFLHFAKVGKIEWKFKTGHFMLEKVISEMFIDFIKKMFKFVVNG